MKLSDYMADFFAEYGIEFNYIFTGGAIAHLIDSCWEKHNQNPEVLKPICVLHEQSGSMAIDAYTRITDKPGLMMATSGPGATNLLTGMACSYYDSIPGIYVTGQVRTWETKGESKQRQLGFQETDIVSMAEPITKYAVLIEDPRDIRYELEKAMWLATEGRPGPVLIDLPMDVQWADIDPDQLRSFVPPIKNKPTAIEVSNIKQVAEWIRSAKKPTILCGGGIRNAHAIPELKALAELCNIPVVSSFGGNDSFAHDHPLYSGLIGTMGSKAGNHTLNDSDLLLVLGSRLSWRQVRSKPDQFATQAKIVHVDIDREELNQHVSASLAFDWDVKEFIIALINELKDQEHPNHQQWASKSRQSHLDTPFCKPEYYQQEDCVQPYVFMKTLSEMMADDDVLVIDAGQNVMWGMQATEPRADQRLLTAWGHSPMGYSLPAAMGVAAHLKGSPQTLCTIGDGGFQVNVQELQTIKYYNLPVKIFIMNNYCYGAIKDYQDGNLESRYFATCPEYGYEAPDFLAISKAYNITACRIESHADLKEKLDYVLNHEGPIICDVNLGNDTFVTLDP
ncbi:thiamine pyrophosphate-binding protein [Neptuniibacter sp. QD48_55]|uniref:thiamine pyrophosphate-binding protein n=1 Tax=Neptuniibacter sp. QD48_55 TaxID=3398212 RepID=UPI0039F640A2